MNHICSETVTLSFIAQIAFEKEFSFECEVIGKSMHPVLYEGDRVEISQVRPERIKWGEIIVFSYGGRYLAHRVVKNNLLYKGYFLTLGDSALIKRYEKVYPEFIIGKITARKRDGIRIPLTGTFKTPAGGIFSIINRNMRLLVIYAKKFLTITRFYSPR